MFKYFFLTLLLAASIVSALDKISAEKCLKSPVIDGKLSESIWNKCKVYNNFHVLKEKDKTASNTSVRLAFDNAWLYIGANCENPDMKTMKPVLDGRNKKARQDDSLEIFLDPGTSGKQYLHYMLGFGNARDKRLVTTGVKEEAGWNYPWLSATDIRDDGWSAEIAIPLSLINSLGNLETIRMNIGRNMRTPIIDPCGVHVADKFISSSLYPVIGSFHEITKAGPLNGLGSLKIEIVPLASFNQVKVKPYHFDHGANFYSINLILKEESDRPGSFDILITDMPTKGEKNKTEYKVQLNAKEEKQIHIPVKAKYLGSRDIDISLRNSMGNILQHMVLKKPAELKIMSAYLDRNYYTTEKNAVAVCLLNLPHEKLKELIISATTETGKCLTEKRIISSEMRLQLPIDIFVVGSHSINIELKDATSGNLLYSTNIQLIKRKPNPGNEWKIDKINRVVLDNGNPFFPISAVCDLVGRSQEEKEWMIQKASELNFNTLVDLSMPSSDLTKQEIIEIQELAKRYNLYIMPYPEAYAKDAGKLDMLEKYLAPRDKLTIRNPRAYRHLLYLKSEIVGNPEFKKLSILQKNEIFKELYDKSIGDIMQSVDVMKKYNNMMGYFIFDEPVKPYYFNQYAFGRDFYKRINRQDGYHPVAANFHGVPPYTENAYDWYDIQMNDPYWVPPADKGYYSISRVVVETSRSVQNTSHLRQVAWIMPIAERWAASRKRILTCQEQFCQSFLAIICGAKGLAYFRFPRTEYAQETFKKLNAQLTVLAPAIVGNQVKQTIRYFRDKVKPAPVVFDPYIYDDNGPEVLVKVFQDKDGYILLAANRKYFPVKVKYAFPAINGNVKSMFSAKEFKVTNSFSDELKGYGTRAYRLGKAVLPESNMNVDVTISYCSKQIPKPENVYANSYREGKKNEFPNPSFEETTIPDLPDYHWPVSNNDKAGIGASKSNWKLEKENPYHGKYCLKMRGGQSWRQLQTLCAPQNEKDLPYTFSVYLRGNREGIACRIHAFGKIEKVKVGKAWKRYQISGIIPGKASSYTLFRIMLPAIQDGELMVDAMQLEKGNQATSFINEE